MKSLRLFLFAAVALAQLGVPAGAIWIRSQTLSKGRLWKFRTTPVDPVDAMRGRYVALAFTAAKVPQGEPLPPSSSAYAFLKEGSNGFAEVDHLSNTGGRGDDFIKVEPGTWWNGEQHVSFPFDRFWVTEKIAPEAERAYAAGSRKDKENAYATVRVHDGDAALEQLYIDDQPLVEYLRKHPPQ